MTNNGGNVVRKSPGKKNLTLDLPDGNSNSKSVNSAESNSGEKDDFAHFEERHDKMRDIADNVSIYRGQGKEWKEDRLVKRVPRGRGDNGVKYDEIKITMMLKSKYVPTLLGVYTDRSYDYLTFRYVAGVMDVEEYITRIKYTAEDVNWISRQLMYITRHIHTHGVVHLDIKLKNFIIGPKAGAGDKLMVQMIDFGISHRLDKKLKYRPIGTVLYAEPDLLFTSGDFAGHEWSKLSADRLRAIDYWAVGICILLLHFPQLIKEFGAKKNQFASAQFIKMVIGGDELFARDDINRFIDENLRDLLNVDWRKRNLGAALRKFAASGRSTSSQKDRQN
jgi:serine/threonine protein kinase